MTEETVRRAYPDLVPGEAVERAVMAQIETEAQAPPPRRRWPGALAAAAMAAGVVLLLRPWSASPGPAPAPSSASRVAEERKADQAAYDRRRDDLHAKHAGEWAVIANGKLVAVSPRLEDVLDAAPKAAHRFVFKVGEDGDVDVGGANFWYGPRFAGPPLGTALGMDIGYFSVKGIRFTKNGKSVTFDKAPPFYRSRLTIGPPGKPGESLDVFVGTCGPPLFLGPDDVGALGLARYEVPGIATELREPHRRVLLRVAVPEIGAEGILIGITPAFPRERFVNYLRFRNRNTFGSVSCAPGTWVLFGVDHLLGEGKTPEQALEAGRDQSDTHYQRYLTKVPVPTDPLVCKRSDFGEPRKVTLGGREVEVRSESSDGPFLASAEVARELHLELAEEFRSIVLTTGGKGEVVRAGYAPLGEGGKLALVIVDAPLFHVPTVKPK